jgi:hypothetical protein
VTSALKIQTVRAYAEVFDLDTLVETGTCFGDLIFGVRDTFKEIYSIELAKHLFECAVVRFNDDHGVHLFHGDSASILPTFIQALSPRVLFWLDAHGVGCPVMRELETILACRPQAVILIDDAIDFTGHNGYPTLEKLQQTLQHYRVCIKDNIIRAYPKEAA